MIIKCTAGRTPGAKDSRCHNPADCRFCGFNESEAEHRRCLLRTKGLTMGPDYLRRLYLGRKEANKDASGGSADQGKAE